LMMEARISSLYKVVINPLKVIEWPPYRLPIV
jgi:hypothetical protein